MLQVFCGGIDMGDDWEPHELSLEHRKEFADAYFRKMMFGLLWAGGGTLVTVWSMTNGRGGILFWGAIIFGIYDFFKGLNGWLKYR
jgi:hypothetical protein